MGPTKGVFKKILYKPTCGKDGLHIYNSKIILVKTLSEFPKIFEGKKGDWKGKEMPIRLKEASKLYYAKPSPVPLSQREVYEVEVERQCFIRSLHKLIPKEVVQILN